MKVDATVDRKINEEGNHVLIVTGEVLSDNQQGVLPAGKEYVIADAKFDLNFGTLKFSFSVEAKEPAVAIEVPKLLSELTSQEQDEAFFKSQLTDPSLDETSKFNIQQKLAEVPAVAEVETPGDAGGEHAAV